MKKIPIPQISYFRSTGFMEFYSFYNSTVACLFNFADGGHYPATPYHRMYRYNSFKFVSNLVSQSMFVTQRKSLPDPNFWETLRINNLLVRSKVLPQRYYFCTYQYGNVYYNACRSSVSGQWIFVNFNVPSDTISFSLMDNDSAVHWEKCFLKSII